MRAQVGAIVGGGLEMVFLLESANNTKYAIAEYRSMLPTIMNRSIDKSLNSTMSYPAGDNAYATKTGLRTGYETY